MTLVHRSAIAILVAALAFVLARVADARDLFILSAGGVADSGHDAAGLIDDALSHEGAFSALGLQPSYDASLEYVGIADAIHLQASAFGTNVVLSIPSTGFRKTFAGATPDAVQDQVKDFLEGPGAHQLARFLKRTNSRTPLAVLDGNPRSTTALFARGAFDRFGIEPLRSRQSYAEEQLAKFGHFDLSVAGGGGAIDADPYDSLYVAEGAVTLGGDFEPGVGVYLSALGQYRNFDGAQVYDAGLELAVPLLLVRAEGKDDPMRWTVTPVVQAGGGASREMLAGGFMVGGGAVSSFGWSLGPLELTIADEFLYYSGVPLGEIGGVRIDAEIDQWITRNGVKMALYPFRHDWLSLEGGAKLTHFLGSNAAVDSFATPFVGIGVKAFDRVRLRVSWEADFGEHGYAVYTGRAHVGFEF
jgi:hypothetical protein